VHARRLLQLHAPAAHLQVRGAARPAPGGAARPRAHPPHTRALSRSGGFGVLGLERRALL